MDQRELSATTTGALRTALQGWQRGIWTAIPGIVKYYSAADNTVTVQPAIRAVVVAHDPKTGDEKNTDVTLPQLIKVPVVQIGGGGFLVDFQPATGDEVLVVFSSRCIDGWWQSGGVQKQTEWRAHDLNDGIAIPGLWSVPRVPAGIGGGGIKLRTVDNSTYVQVTNGNVAIVGNLTVTGTMTNNGVNVGSTHVHGGVQTGGSNTAVPH